ncbi:MAG: LLM class flavin-dependent oxidoreductase [Kurthia sp.]|nr:LLM class flavin-dependent oxidoreductase [Candidatus Kurthia equi]
MKNVKLSVLDLVAVGEGMTAGEAIHNSVELAQKAEELGYERYWFAEHHNSASIASSATSLLIGKIAENTKTIRVGSGGIMLPNHKPLIIAEQFGTLETMYPDRIDLGLGRAPGTDYATAQALGRNPYSAPNAFPDDIDELLMYLGDNKGAQIHAYPGENTNIPVYILGSSLYSAELAAKLGLPYAFASHFAPNYLEQAFQIYRKNFMPSDYLAEPYTIACVNGMAANTTEEAQKMVTSLYQYFLGIVGGAPKKLQPPVDSMKEIWTMDQRSTVLASLRYTFIGDEEKVKAQLEAFIHMTEADEIMFTSHIYDAEQRQRSYKILMSAMKSLQQ